MCYHSIVSASQKRHDINLFVITPMFWGGKQLGISIGYFWLGQKEVNLNEKGRQANRQAPDLPLPRRIVSSEAAHLWTPPWPTQSCRRTDQNGPKRKDHVSTLAQRKRRSSRGGAIATFPASEQRAAQTLPHEHHVIPGGSCGGTKKAKAEYND